MADYDQKIENLLYDHPVDKAQLTILEEELLSCFPSGVQVLSDMPRGGEISNQTLNCAIKLSNIDDKRKVLIKYYAKRVRIVEVCMGSLDSEARDIIRMRYFDIKRVCDILCIKNLSKWEYQGIRRRALDKFASLLDLD